MADYTPLLTRAITGQDETARAGIYARARDALERQLRGFEPKLEEAHILAELDGLEAAIRTVEASAIGTVAPPAAPEVAAGATGDPAPVAEESPAQSEPLAKVDEIAPAEEVEAAPTAPEPAAEPAEEAAAQDAPEAPAEIDETAPPPAEPEATPVDPTPELTTDTGAFVMPSSTSEAAQGDAPDESVVLTRDSTADVSAPPMIEPVIPPSDRPRMPLRHEAGTSRKPLLMGAIGALVVMLAIGAVAVTRRSSVDPLRSPPVPTQAASVESSKTEGRLATEPAKPADQQPQPAQEATKTAPSGQEAPLSTSTRAFMVMENPGNAPSQYEGAAVWSFEDDPAAKGQKVVRMLIAYPGADMTLDFTLSRNTDAKLGASHLLMAVFELPKGAEPVRELSPIEWREREATQGSVLRGAVVPVQDNVFMVTLDKAAEAANLDLLLRQKWAVFEFRLANGRRGAALVEKGAAGDRAVAEAITTWK